MPVWRIVLNTFYQLTLLLKLFKFKLSSNLYHVILCVLIFIWIKLCFNNQIWWHLIETIGSSIFPVITIKCRLGTGLLNSTKNIDSA